MKNIGELSTVAPRILCIQLTSGYSDFWTELRKVAKGQLAALIAIPVRKFSYPGKTTDEIAEAVTSIKLTSDPCHVIIHAGTNNLPMDSAQSCAAKIKSLALKVNNKFPNSRIGISGITYRKDIQVDSKCNEINETVRLMAGDNNIAYINNSVIDNSRLNGSRLHLNAISSSLLAVQFIKFLRSGSGKHTQT